MENITVQPSDNHLNQLVYQAVTHEQPILLKTAQGNAVLVAEKDWNAIQETLYLQSIPNLVSSIQEGGKTALEDCVDETTVRNILNG
ncbi:type II toxin-antitoxin system Phd/YefM family antitoxin [Spirulina subsalsa FACHB-351]|uniref:Antitoxin n=1 Tax=Spirulina subsalsa FACHB-351 TaxID=234711 RepID=A0ABT3LBL0_9CYAN|nr:type II toxin-antitoxin system Phd/YefM family antitoxin [Spirulina subsalsa]MCW6038902.1 type II toxin-antitoxin system Phd/YefM family antitoxin [Spirulina subsalsa FACHB-351]